jgi:hypothetical protein
MEQQQWIISSLHEREKREKEERLEQLKLPTGHGNWFGVTESHQLVWHD